MVKIGEILGKKEFMVPEKAPKKVTKKESYQNNISKTRTANGSTNKNYTQANKVEPYNFVPFSNFVIKSPLTEKIDSGQDVSQKQAKFAEYLCENKTYSGYFETTIKNITPMLINMNDKFFATAGGLCIPGSSVRGCIKNIFKIVTSSAWSADKDNADFFDRRLYFRGLYAPKGKYQGVVEHYREKMISGKMIKSKPGFLVRNGDGEYFVVPAQSVAIPKEPKVDWTMLTGEKILDRNNQGKNALVYIGIDPNFEKPKNINGDKKITAVPGIKWHDEYVDVFSGGIDGKKKFHRINTPNLKGILSIDDAFIKAYKDDDARNGISLIGKSGEENNCENELFGKGFVIKNRCIKYDKKAYAHYGEWIYIFHTGFLNDKLQPFFSGFVSSKENIEKYLNDKIKNVLKAYEKDKICPEGLPKFIKDLAEKYEYVVPCFYVDDGQIVTSFGAGPYYRINYTKSIADHLPKGMKANANVIDYTDAVFGNKEAWASRVFFEDFYIDKSSKSKEQTEAKVMKSLMTPRPTSFQNYLTARGGTACHWDDNAAELRGYKMYWHHKSDWIEPKMKEGDSIHSKVCVLKEMATFKGKIRFENLTEVELGALAKVFQLGNKNDICFKIGMGKPLGLGSIEFKSDLFLKRQDYYRQLFNENGFVEAEKVDGKRFIEAFDKELTADVNLRKRYDTSLDALEKILTFPEGDRQGKSKRSNNIQYTPKEKSPDRIPLPTISEVVKKLK